MTEPVELLVPPEQVRPGDVLLDYGSTPVEVVFVGVTPDYVYAFIPEQVPLPRGMTVRIRRAPTPPPPPGPEQQLAEVAALALALAEQAAGPAAKDLPAVRKRVADAADRVRKVVP